MLCYVHLLLVAGQFKGFNCIFLRVRLALLAAAVSQTADQHQGTEVKSELIRASKMEQKREWISTPFGKVLRPKC